MSSNVNISQSGGISVKVFNGNQDDETYEDYKNRITCVLSLKEVDYVLEPSFTVPTAPGKTDDEKLKIKHDKIARTWIKLTCQGNPHYLVKNCDTAKEMIDKLDDEYELGKESYDMETLDLEFEQLTLEDGEKPSVFFVKLEELNIKYDQFQETNGKQYKKDERELIIKVSNSVGEKYDSVIETWKTKKDDSKSQAELYKDLKKVLCEYYKKHFSKLTELKGNNSKKGRSLVMQLGTTDAKVKCSHCGKNHPEENCWFKYPHLRPKGKNKGNQNKGNSLEKKGPCWICGGDHQKKDCPKNKMNQRNGGNA